MLKIDLENHKEICVLFVCMGNICRSPTAEAVFRYKAKIAGLEEMFHVDSAGTHNFHIGKSPDKRAVKVADRRGYSMQELRARQIHLSDFKKFQYILAMDNHNLTVLNQHCPSEQCHKLQLLMQYSGEFSGKKEVPDPYFGSYQNFEKVLTMIEKSMDGFLKHIQRKGIK